MTESKETRNARVQDRYDELMREGKHGHYETLFRIVREELVRATLAEQPAPVVPDDAAWRLEQLKNQWADGRSGSLGAAQAYINGLECSLAAAIPPGYVVVRVERIELIKSILRGYPPSIAREDALNTCAAMLAARPGEKP